MVGIEVGEIVGMDAANFRERGFVGTENRFTPLHGFNDGETEAFGDGREEKGAAMGIEPAPLGVGDNAYDVDIGVLGELRTEGVGILGFVVAGNDKVIVGEASHEREEGMDLFFLLHLAKRQEEGRGVWKIKRGERGFLGTYSEVFDPVVDDMDGFAVQ